MAFDAKRTEMIEQPVAWVVCGDAEFTGGDHKPNWEMITSSEVQMIFWRDECHLRVRPVFLGPAL